MNIVLMATNVIISSQPTLPETNIAPRNKPSQKETSIPTIHSGVGFREGTL